MKKNIILFKDDLPEFRSRIHYILNFIEQHPLTGGRLQFSRSEDSSFDRKLAYGIQEVDTFFIPAQKVFFHNQKTNFVQLVANIYQFNEQELYSVEKKKNFNQAFLVDGEFQFDLIETIFFHISRYEEWFFQEGREDEHGRMAAEAQFLVKNHLHRQAVVDKLVLSFLRAVGIDTPDQPTKYRITHDIDFIEKRNDFFGILKSMGGAILKRQDPGAALQIWKSRAVKNPYDTFDWMLRKEESIEKVIYFLVDGNTKYDEPYDLQLPVFTKAIQLAKERDYKIGIHPSYDTWKTEGMIQKEREKLQKAIGFEIAHTRQHFLRFSFPETLMIIEKMGFKEDSSLGYADRLGFRCGTGFGYQLYDFEKERAFDFIETPLVFMDSALFAESNHHSELVTEIWEKFLSENQFNTKISFNFHNSRFYDADIQGIPLKMFYERLFKN